MDWHFIFGGAVVGFIVGATGVGGGSLMTPLLTLGFGIPAHVAVGTDLLFASLTKAGGAVAHARRGNVSWPITLWLAVGSVPAAAITLVGLHTLSPDAASFSQLVTPILGAALLLTATALAFKGQIQALGRRLARR
ncbi:MAG TPA: sulfite exporter TauE/SafE family protein, partial [Burkholderiaceae bacterium]|nr:sulfite exporter TauE/SafE family protein [Burkholderiaceae bacterium]